MSLGKSFPEREWPHDRWPGRPIEPKMSTEEKVNILMVDDQPGKLLSYEAILSDLGENLIKASSAKDALDKLLKNDVAAVLMDVSMPDIDGFELAEIIRQHPRFQKTAIIFVSAVHLTDLDRLKGYQHGAVDYLSVPVVPEVLRAKVKVFAELHRKKLQLERLNVELENRVAERTQELEQKAKALQKLNNDLAQKNQELDAIVQTAPDIIFSRQADGSRDYISGRFYDYTGAPLGSAVGLGWLEYVHPDDKPQSLLHWLHCVESGETYESEYRMRRADGQFRWFRARAVPLRDAHGDIIKWYGTCSDIHDSKVLEQSIRDNAIELERLVDSRTAELRRLSGRLMTMQDEERRRIAREIHDGLGQELAAAKMILDGIIAKDPAPAVQHASLEASQLVDRAIQCRMVGDVEHFAAHVETRRMQPARLLRHPLRAQVEQRDACAVLCERLGVAEPEAARPARDDHPVPLDTEQFCDLHGPCLGSG